MDITLAAFSDRTLATLDELERQGHPSAAALREHLRTEHPGISLATGPTGMYPAGNPAWHLAQAHDDMHARYRASGHSHLSGDCTDQACAEQGCPEHPIHNGPDHTYEQHHAPEDHEGGLACFCTVYKIGQVA